MEPADAEVTYIIRTTVLKVTEKRQFLGTEKGEDGKFYNVSKPLGWFVLFEGSQEWLNLGPDKPRLKPNDHVTIRITKDDIPREAPIQ